MSKILSKYTERFVSKWLILIMDIFIISISFVFATTVRFNFELTYIDPQIFKYHLLSVILVRVSSFLYLNTFSGIIRHTSIEDAKLLFKSVVLSSIELVLLSLLDLGSYTKFVKIPYSLLAIDFFIALFGLIASRFIIKAIFDNLLNSFKSQQMVIIYGAGQLGLITKNTILKDKKKKNQILCFIDDNSSKIGKSIEGTKVVSLEDALRLYINSVDFQNVSVEVILAIQYITSNRKNEIVDKFLELGITVKSLPPVKTWINGELSINQIKEINIDDLLEREPIKLNNKFVMETLSNKVIFITGAAGSIGSELVRQILPFGPSKLVLIDQAESPLYDLETELTRLTQKGNTATDLVLETRNICNKVQMEKLFIKHSPNVVFHAAAYKHVPLMEKNPFKAVEVNVFGTKLVADLASKYKVKKFVMISTDKAVNPTNVMGASKRLAEIYVQSLNSFHKNESRFIVTRFGNVLGSNGSVIPLFKRQIAAGGPVTVTHPDIIRYFMTIPEACQLVLEAGTMGKGGEVFVFDMGEPVKIVDLAKRMIKLSGFEVDKQIEIKFTGLRPGEKLYEELIGSAENNLATYNPKLMIAKIVPEDYDQISKKLNSFDLKLNEWSNLEIVGFLKNLVPEYISNNSPFEKLDILKEFEIK
ncbi:polysaccharide biosynthesis protein [Lacihabitans sp. CCS-44]|uniref:polysaccharide biosynthesis protein n=1 Tax=Lacihabitans sp. CCS-44 TaxID=2487331 RepID=UPI0020CCBB35|nr:nucleoside-diphosphate sugar epimerase/dehydratase [Lacihabitans sp. CCS-44]MCP9754963.1 polysaccharide biosynthesis protein [Lacihabitans sp. CCS-44]